MMMSCVRDTLYGLRFRRLGAAAAAEALVAAGASPTFATAGKSMSSFFFLAAAGSLIVVGCCGGACLGATGTVVEDWRRASSLFRVAVCLRVGRLRVCGWVGKNEDTGGRATEWRRVDEAGSVV